MTAFHVKHHQNGDTGPSEYHHLLQKLMAECHMTGARLARAVDVHPNTVARWATGKAQVPGAVLAYLTLLAKVKALAR